MAGNSFFPEIVSPPSGDIGPVIEFSRFELSVNRFFGGSDHAEAVVPSRFEGVGVK